MDTSEAKRTTEGPHVLGKGRGKGQREQAGLNPRHRGLQRRHVVGEARAGRPGRRREERTPHPGCALPAPNTA